VKKTAFQLTLLSLLVALIWGIGGATESSLTEEAGENSDLVSLKQAAVKKYSTDTSQVSTKTKPKAKDVFDSLADDAEEIADKEDFHDPEALEKHGVDRLMMMAFHNKGDVFLEAINEIKDIKKLSTLADKDGNGLLHWAVMGGCESCFIALIAKGIDVNQANHRGETPLVFASASGEGNMVKRLLQAGADPNVEFNKAGYTLLMDASFEGLTPVAHDLIKAKANINAVDNQGQSALHYAAKEGHRELIKLLIDRGADSSIADKNKMKPLDYALKYHDSSIRELFGL
jgi:Na+-transporting methylmalonyl-CoA/oxaloacetate decarboxylase gamma subunit